MDTDPQFLAVLYSFAVANQNLGAWKHVLGQDPESIRAYDGMERAKQQLEASYNALLDLVQPS